MRICRVPGLAGALLAAAVAMVPAPGAAAGEAAPPARPVRPSEARSVDAVLPSPEEAWLGITLPAGNVAPRLLSVDADSPAGRAGLRAGDLVLSLDGIPPPDALAAAWMIRVRSPGERVRLELRRGEERVVVDAVLESRPGPGSLHRGPRFRLAVVPLALADRPRPAAPDDAALDRLFFSVDSHRGRLPSRRVLFGSVRDYWRDQSLGALELVGRVLPTVAVPAATTVFAEQEMGAGPDTLYARAVAMLLDREGADVLDEFDGVAFLYPGAVASESRRALWPHRAFLRAGARVLPYFVKHLDSGDEPEPIGVLCHEFGHLLGLPDQYGQAHRTGVGDFCLMALGHRGGGESGADRPFGLCAWCRTVLRWCRPVAVDAGVQQDLVLAPWNEGPGEALLVAGAAPGESFLLENRPRAGWDAELPGGGLLVWRAGAPLGPGDPPERPWLDLVEAHGMDAPDASLLRPDEVPFPGKRGGVLSEETHPGSAGVLRLSWIRRETDHRIAFRLGERGPFTAPPPHEAFTEVDAAGYATLRDPITGRDCPVRVRVPDDIDPHDLRPERPPEGIGGD